MEKSTFKITIDAPREKVWEVLWGDPSYQEWTAAFAEGSRVETNWEKGSKVLFLGNDNQGMVARIEDKVPNEYMSFQHLGEINNGVEDLTSDKVKAWAGAYENYTLTNVNGKTELVVDMDLNDDYKDYFGKTWPLALDKVKELSEKK
ncbi:SRPBCC domain-containing protein [Chitinophaga polysaccharea]|uniref:SRPBCC domain-containing protein n=1 Tax=Chitinophaga polysaccharea TaxID=1293035 RepID=UPI00115925F3|nr:SRPBCC domain-containing protein [Chitinophaga polysaccharea]